MSSITNETKRVLSGGYHQISSRVANLGYAGTNAYKGIVSAVLAVINNLGDLATLGSVVSNRFAAKNSASNFGAKMGDTYARLLRVINPDAKAPHLPTKSEEEYKLKSGRIAIKQLPFELRKFSIWQQEKMNDLNTSGWWINRHITTRFAAPLTALAGIFKGAAYTTLGVHAALLSVAACGTIEELNSVARDYLSIPGWMLNQLHQGLLGIIRPDLV